MRRHTTHVHCTHMCTHIAHTLHMRVHTHALHAHAHTHCTHCTRVPIYCTQSCARIACTHTHTSLTYVHRHCTHLCAHITQPLHARIHPLHTCCTHTVHRYAHTHTTHTHAHTPTHTPRTRIAQCPRDTHRGPPSVPPRGWDKVRAVRRAPCAAPLLLSSCCWRCSAPAPKQVRGMGTLHCHVAPQHATAWHHTAPHATTSHHMALRSNTQHHMLTHGNTWHHTAPRGTTWHHTTLHGTTWHHTLTHSTTF